MKGFFCSRSFQVENRKTKITNGLDWNDAIFRKIFQEKWILGIWGVIGMSECPLHSIHNAIAIKYLRVIVEIAWTEGDACT